MLPLTIPTGESISVEVDMGSDCLILDERFAGLSDGERRVVEGVDETGNAYTRAFGGLPPISSHGGAGARAGGSRRDVPADHLRRPRRPGVPEPPCRHLRHHPGSRLVLA